MSCASCKVNSVSNIVGFPAAYSFFYFRSSKWLRDLPFTPLSPFLPLSFIISLFLSSNPPSFLFCLNFWFKLSYIRPSHFSSIYGDGRRVALLPFYLNFDPKKAFSFLLPSPYSCSPLDISSQIQPH